eukprot:164256-Amphidinium_carterae.2
MGPKTWPMLARNIAFSEELRKLQCDSCQHDSWRDGNCQGDTCHGSGIAEMAIVKVIVVMAVALAILAVVKVIVVMVVLAMTPSRATAHHSRGDEEICGLPRLYMGRANPRGVEM